jgi:hypothetical protein
MEKGLFRKDEGQIAQDTNNQEDARQRLADLLDIEIVGMDNFSIWDWEFRRGKLVAIGEYRRRFNNFDKYKKFALIGVVAIVVIYVIGKDANYYSKNGNAS